MYQFTDPITITAEHYLRATGRHESQDDLERSNCDRAGLSGHSNCGWNHEKNLPVFMCGPDSNSFRLHFKPCYWMNLG